MDRYIGAAPAVEQASILLTSAGRGWHSLEAEFLSIPRGRHHVAGGEMHRLGIHFGTPVNADCRCDGRHSRRIQKHGDIDVIPAGLDGSWEDDAACTILRLRLAPALLSKVAEELDGPPGRFGLRAVFQLRDPRIEAIATAIKAELEADIPSDPLYAQSLGLALAARLMAIPDGPDLSERTGLSSRQYHLLADFIESHLDRSLSLAELAQTAGLGLSQLKQLFPRSFGMPVHQYVVRRRVERARALLLTGDMPMSEVALAAGFAHQSHMATWMRRLTGMTPGEILRQRL
ncbi:helix-turn-helix domain-containing protein [Labrys okinawensis]|uniref:helix-turn-helix domain-containing protein n=1 Tax=Labrys okinawensis TaxID=346911 RepID=UPI0039BCDF1C